MDPLTIGGIALLTGYALKQRSDKGATTQGHDTSGDKPLVVRKPTKEKPASQSSDLVRMTAEAAKELAKMLNASETQTVVLVAGLSLAVAIGILAGSWLVGFAILFITGVVYWVVGAIELASTDNSAETRRAEALAKYWSNWEECNAAVFAKLKEAGATDEQANRISWPVADGFAAFMNYILYMRCFALAERLSHGRFMPSEPDNVWRDKQMAWYAGAGFFVGTVSGAQLYSGINPRYTLPEFKTACGYKTIVIKGTPAYVGSGLPGSAPSRPAGADKTVLAPEFANFEALNTDLNSVGTEFANIAAFKAWARSQNAQGVSDIGKLQQGIREGRFHGPINEVGQLYSQSPSFAADNTCRWTTILVSP